MQKYHRAARAFKALLSHHITAPMKEEHITIKYQVSRPIAQARDC